MSAALATRYDAEVPAAPRARHLELLPAYLEPAAPARRRRRGPSAAVRRRRALLALTVASLLAVPATSALRGPDRVGGGPLTAPDPAPQAIVVVAPGDTLWSIARRLSPGGDVRPLVSRMAAANPGPLVPGQRLEVPAR